MHYSHISPVPFHSWRSPRTHCRTRWDTGYTWSACTHPWPGRSACGNWDNLGGWVKWWTIFIVGCSIQWQSRLLGRPLFALAGRRRPTYAIGCEVCSQPLLLGFRVIVLLPLSKGLTTDIVVLILPLYVCVCVCVCVCMCTVRWSYADMYNRIGMESQTI